MNASNTATIQNYINRVVLVLDASRSMSPISADVVRVFDNQIKYLAKRSQELSQETRVSVYLFASDVKCLIFDRDVLRLPTLASYYRPDGQTALIDGVLKSIEDLKQLPEMYGDFAVLNFVISDGAENASNSSSSDLFRAIKSLPENWTVAALVPDQNAVFEAKRAGFPAENVSVWDTSSRRGFDEVGEVIRQSTDNFMKARARGIRSVNNLFTVDTSKLSTAAVRSSLQELKPDQYKLLNVHKEAVIKPFVESWKLPFVQGSAYYQLTKPEKVQGYKQVCVQNKVNGKVYAGAQARSMLGLPDYEVKIEPASHPTFTLFVQSSSLNRKLVGGTQLLVLT